MSKVNPHYLLNLNDCHVALFMKSLFTDRSNSDGGFNGHAGIQRYTTSKYTDAIHAGLCTLTPTYDRPPNSNSNSSHPDYRVCMRNTNSLMYL